MTEDEIKLQLMMGSSSKILNWLKKEGVTTKEQVRKKLSSAISGNIVASTRHGRDMFNESTAINEIFKHFK